MKPDDAERIFNQALQITNPEERMGYVRGACGDDEALRARVEALLQADHKAAGFLPTEPGDRDVAPIPFEAPGDMIGRYKLMERIGEGGCGVVYVAEQREPVRRRVALKIIKLGMDTKQVIARFEAERQALALMDHPNIAKVLDAGSTETGRPYFVMELVRGVKITEYCDQNELSTQERIALFIQVCNAIQHAHQKGIIHRDIKPSNILVTVNDEVAVPKVIDFGIAKATTQQLLADKTVYTAFEQLIGTPAYMSPEQTAMTSVDIDTRSDVYALGVLLYELLTGSTPFDAKELLKAGLDEIRRIIREQEPLRPSTRVGTMVGEDQSRTARHRHLDAPRLIRLLQGELDWIVLKALEKDRKRRYETAHGLALDLKRYLDNEPVTAVAPSMGYRMRKFVLRNRGTVAAATTIAVLLIAGIATSVSLWKKAEHARDQESAANEQLREQVAQTEKAQALARERQQVAEDALSKVQTTVERLQIEQAEGAFTQGDSVFALAYLGDVLRANPSNYVAGTRLVSALVNRSFCQPQTDPLRHEEAVRSAEFSPDGEQLLTASSDNTARVWNVRTGEPLTVPLKHGGTVASAHFSPDGLQVATASADKTARVWDARTGQPQTDPLVHEGVVYSAKFSPDGQRLATASSDNTARVWNVRTGEPLTAPLKHAGMVLSAQFSPDGRRIVTSSYDRSARVWDAITGQPLTNPLEHEGCVHTAQFSPDGLRVVTASADKTARVWDAGTGQPLTEPLRHKGEVNFAQFSPDGVRVATASDDNTARVWDARSGQPLNEPLKHEGAVHTVRFSPDGLRVVTASIDKTARIWDTITGAPVSERMRHSEFILSARFSPDGRWVVTASFDGTARVWNVPAENPLRDLCRHTAGAKFAQFSPDGQRVATASYDNTARVWDAHSGSPLTKPLRHDALVYSAQFSPDGLWLLTASYDKTARVWDARTGEPLTEQLKHEGPVYTARFSPDGLRVVTASSDKTARVWDARSGRLLIEPLAHDALVFSAQFSPNGQYVVTASRDKTARVWDARSGRPLGKPLEHEGDVWSAQFSPDGRWVVTTSGDKTARLWDAQTSHALAPPLCHEDLVIGAQFSPDSQKVVTASRDNTARIWDACTGKPLTDPLRHDGAVPYAEFSPDGLRVVTASADRTARVWDVRTGAPLSDPLRHEDALHSARFSPDGQWVVTASEDHRVRVWDTFSAGGSLPVWFLDWVGAWIDRPLSVGSGVAFIPEAERRRLQAAVSMSTDTDDFTRVAQWLQSSSTVNKAISPHSTVTTREYVRRRIEENTLDSLREAVLLSPTNSLALARLADLVEQQEPEKNPGRLEEAALYRRLAEKWNGAEKNANSP